MNVIKILFSWCPGPLGFLFTGGLTAFILFSLFKVVAAVIDVISDLIPGW